MYKKDDNVVQQKQVRPDQSVSSLPPRRFTHVSRKERERAQRWKHIYDGVNQLLDGGWKIIQLIFLFLHQTSIPMMQWLKPRLAKYCDDLYQLLAKLSLKFIGITLCLLYFGFLGAYFKKRLWFIELLIKTTKEISPLIEEISHVISLLNDTANL